MSRIFSSPIFRPRHCALAGLLAAGLAAPALAQAPAAPAPSPDPLARVYAVPSHLAQVKPAGRHAGTVLSFDRTRVMQLQLKAGASMPSHAAKEHVLVITQKGRVEFVFDGDKRVTLTPGELLYMLPGENHALNATEDWEGMLVRVMP